VLRDRSVRRSAQDDVFVRGLEIQMVGICRKHEQIEKVTGSQRSISTHHKIVILSGAFPLTTKSSS
jgi:hypothetical protein